MGRATVIAGKAIMTFAGANGNYMPYGRKFMAQRNLFNESILFSGVLWELRNGRCSPNYCEGSCHSL